MLTDQDWPGLPLDRGALRRAGLAYRQEYRAGLTGAHLTRRRGQSLEIRELVHYAPGDDIRHVDWRASARYGLADSQRWLVRRFVAEEQLTLSVSLDARPTMHGPEGADKLLVGLWLAEALAELTLQGSDRVVLHPLFAEGSLAPVVLRGTAARGRIRPALRRLLTAVTAPRPATGLFRRLRAVPTPLPPTLNLATLEPQLPPTAIWIIITDGYLTHPNRDTLRQRMRRAAAGARWVIFVELDSWTAERDALGSGARRIDGPGLPPTTPELEIDKTVLDRVDLEIESSLTPLRTAVKTHLRWTWPPQPAAPIGATFGRWFRSERVFRDLFGRPA